VTAKLRRFETTEGKLVWINAEHVVDVYGEDNDVQMVVSTGFALGWHFKGTVRDVAMTLNGYYDEDR
jgi:hypothetical protein